MQWTSIYPYLNHDKGNNNDNTKFYIVSNKLIRTKSLKSSRSLWQMNAENQEVRIQVLLGVIVSTVQEYN